MHLPILVGKWAVVVCPKIGKFPKSDYIFCCVFDAFLLNYITTLNLKI